MENYFNTIRISNFKSIQEISLIDCSRVNLFIGKPNVGKSNILEAISLLGISNIKFNTDRNLNNFIRSENVAELCYNGNIYEQINIVADKINFNLFLSSTIESSANTDVYDWHLNISADEKILVHYYLDENLNLRESINDPGLLRVKKYTFRSNTIFKNSNIQFLIPPFGTNLSYCIQINSQLKKELDELFTDYNLKLVFDHASQSLKIMKERPDGSIFLIPYHSMADTLQRIIFFKTAVASNKNSVILFEEPEAHSFPPYISHITQEIIHSESNQFFVTTHSPFVLNDFLENCRDELSIFSVNYIDGKTIIKKLTNEELSEIYQYGVDLFTNIESYL